MILARGMPHSPFSAGLIPAGFDDVVLRPKDDANGNRDSAGYTVGTGGTLSASPNATYTYDAAGHLTAKTDTSTGKVTTFAYDHRDRLTGITRKTSGGTVDYRTTYVYDALNRRIAEQVDADGAGAGSPVTTWTVFDGENPYADFDGAGSLQTRYLYSLAVDEILGRTDSSGDTYWYMTDGLGSVRDIFDEWGSSAYHTGYDSFGNKISTTGTGDRFGFTGREHDAALNLYYYRARFYDPATGRFLSKDPIGFEAGDTNLYRYVGNGPQNGTDPTGLDWLDSSANFFAGMGDALSFGITDLAREITGINDGIDHGSIEYVGGIVAGTGLGVAITVAPKKPIRIPGRPGRPKLPGQSDSGNYPKPPGHNSDWTWGPATGETEAGWRWFDPKGGEWRYHSIDKWHPTAHWDYNPWTSWNSAWINVFN